MVCIDRTIFEGAKNLNIEKIIFEVVQINILALHDINNTKISSAAQKQGYICSNSQQYIVWVKIIDFYFMPKIIRILRSCSMNIFLNI